MTKPVSLSRKELARYRSNDCNVNVTISIPLEQIYVVDGDDPELVNCMLGYDEEMIEVYRWKIRAAEKIEPIEVYFLDLPTRIFFGIADRPPYELHDGHHRLEAHRLEGCERIAATVKA